MKLRTLFQEFDDDEVIQVFTTEGHVYVGTVSARQDDWVELSSTSQRTTFMILYTDVSSVRPLVEEAEEAV